MNAYVASVIDYVRDIITFYDYRPNNIKIWKSNIFRDYWQYTTTMVTYHYSSNPCNICRRFICFI